MSVGFALSDVGKEFTDAGTRHETLTLATPRQ